MPPGTAPLVIELSDAGAGRPAEALAGNAPRERDRYWHDAVPARDLRYALAIPAADPWFVTRLLAFADQRAVAVFDVVADRIFDATGASVAGLARRQQRVRGGRAGPRGRGGGRIGDALQAMRRGVAGDGTGRRDLLTGIHLLGDPTLRLRR